MPNAPQVKFQPQPANVGGVPRTISVAATAVNLQSRTFWGAGAPSATTLSPGPQIQNLMYLAANLAANSTPTAPDMYFDVTNFALYICITGGTNATSVWKQISGATQSGGAGAFGIYSSQSVYNPGSVVRVVTQQIVNGVTTTPGTYFCNVAVTVKAPGPVPTIANMVPQFPEPTQGTIYWYLIALGPQVVNICQNGSEQTYINAGSAF
ncbi:MAG TPA: hypothetical protein VGI03_14570 [Verrucomicrobiae bacterium]|jgi:hypothetical protein